MSCLFKIKESLSTCTSMEKRLANYILENKNEVINLSSQALAKKSKTSAATVVRFSKKLGFNGFQHLKIELAKDNDDYKDFSFDEIILQKDNIETLVRKSYASNFKILEQTYNLINLNRLEKAIKLMINAETIYIVGIGGSSIICEDLMHKLSRINKKVVFIKDFHIFLHNLTYITSKDVLLAISYSGETKEILTALKTANENNAPTITITSLSKNSASKISTINLNIPIEEKEIRLGAISSRFSSFIISDLLYVGIAKQNIENTKNKIIKTRNTIKKFR